MISKIVAESISLFRMCSGLELHYSEAAAVRLGKGGQSSYSRPSEWVEPHVLRFQTRYVRYEELSVKGTYSLKPLRMRARMMRSEEFRRHSERSKVNGNETSVSIHFKDEYSMNAYVPVLEKGSERLPTESEQMRTRENKSRKPKCSVK